MLDGILGRGFASKCKSLIKVTKSRIEVIRRKRNATLKFLKKDIADLLASGLDINAYGRAEGLLAELMDLSCYAFVEQCCDFVLKHLSVMQKLRHCPEDCRVAVSSLMFAAARFSDLPELRDLRLMFYERYGNSLELFVRQEFIENSSSKSFTLEKKVKLMQDIASEFSLKWDSRAFELRMSKHPAPVQDQPRTYGSLNMNDDKYKSNNGKDTGLKGDEHDVLSQGKVQHTSDGYRLLNDKESNVSKIKELNPQSRLQVPKDGFKLPGGREDIIYKQVNQLDDHDIHLGGKEEGTMEKHKPRKGDTPLKAVRLGVSSQKKIMENVDGGIKRHDVWENAVPKRGGQETSTCEKPALSPSVAGLENSAAKASSTRNKHDGHHDVTNSIRDVPEEEVSKSKLYYNNAVPPPYTKPNARPKDRMLGSFHTVCDSNGIPKDPSIGRSENAGNKPEKIQQEADSPGHDWHNVGSARANGHVYGNDNHHHGEGIPLPKPRSLRRRHTKTHSHSSHDNDSYSEDTGAVKRRSRSRRRDDTKRGLQILFDDECQKDDEEERMIDRLLIHYSKKPSAYEPERVRRKSKSRHSHDQGSETKNSLQHTERGGPDGISKMTSAPPRSISMPREQNTSSEATKVFTRAASFQPDRSSEARHVHPKLPDYDDLAAQFAALKGR